MVSESAGMDNAMNPELFMLQDSELQPDLASSVKPGSALFS